MWPFGPHGKSKLMVTLERIAYAVLYFVEQCSTEKGRLILVLFL
jgi:hypothetical protein